MGLTKYQKILKLFQKLEKNGLVPEEKLINRIIMEIGSDKRTLDSSMVILTKFFKLGKNGYKLK